MEINASINTALGATPTAAALTVYYDGACPVCSREIAVYRRQEIGRASCRERVYSSV